jgi:hypothetical protein
MYWGLCERVVFGTDTHWSKRSRVENRAKGSISLADAVECVGKGVRDGLHVVHDVPHIAIDLKRVVHTERVSAAVDILVPADDRLWDDAAELDAGDVADPDEVLGVVVEEADEERRERLGVVPPGGGGGGVEGG